MHASKSKWRTVVRRVLLGIGVVAALVTAAAIFGSRGQDPKLMLEQGQAIPIQNTGHSIVELRGLVINDRKDCTVIGNVFRLFSPTKLNVRDVAYHVANCQVVRVEVSTQTGLATYIFDK